MLCIRRNRLTMVGSSLTYCHTLTFCLTISWKKVYEDSLLPCIISAGRAVRRSAGARACAERRLCLHEWRRHQRIQEHRRRPKAASASTCRASRRSPSPYKQPVGGPPVTAPPTRGQPASPGDFPKVDSGTQKARDNDRTQILTDEMRAEERSWPQLQARIQQRRAGTPRRRDAITPSTRTASRRMKDDISRTEKNIEALKREIGNLEIAYDLCSLNRAALAALSLLLLSHDPP